jgi:ABC-2 type transport system ATP-binding protein
MNSQTESLTVSAKGLFRSYGPRVAVRDVSFELRKGEVLGFLGPNGAGKSTTMQMLTGNLAPTAGSVEICGIDLMDKPKAAKAMIGYLPETPPLYRELSVDEYLRLAARLHQVKGSEIGAAVEQAKRRCGLSEVGKRLIGTLSKGFQQRVGIAQAIVHNPDVVILDEPTVGLDPIQIREIRGLIRELGGNHSVILSTHILPEVESVCDRVQIMHDGQLVYSDTIAGLQQFRQGHSLVIGLRAPPALPELSASSGVSGVEPISETQFRIHFDPENNPTDSLVRASVERGWNLYQLSPSQTSLEDVFVQLTQREDHGKNEVQP